MQQPTRLQSFGRRIQKAAQDCGDTCDQENVTTKEVADEIIPQR
jgi:hypothetical protein